MAKTPGKTHAKPPSNVSRVVAPAPQPATPEQRVGPARAGAVQAAALPPPNGAPAAARAGDLMRAPHTTGAPSRAHAARALQRSVGNARLGRIAGAPAQTKLTVGAPGDVYEQEADQVAERVMRMPMLAPPPVQRQCSGCGRTLHRQPDAEGDGMCPACARKLQRIPSTEEEPAQRQMEEEPSPGMGQPPTIQRQADEEGAPGMGQTPAVQRQPEDEESVQRQADEEGAPGMGRTPVVQRQPEDEATVQREVDEEESVQRQVEDEAAPGMGQTPAVQRQPEAEATVQREEDEEATETGMLQAQAAPGQTPAVTPGVESYINASRGGGEPLPEASRATMEPRFGQDFSGVRVHTDSQAAGAAQDLNAQAFTTGRDIYFGAGQYQPGTAPGQRLMAHELTHVVQQQGGVWRQPTRRSRRKTGTYVPYHIHINQEMTPEEFKVAAMLQVFGGVIENVKWWDMRDSYVPEQSPYTLDVEIQLLKHRRGQVSKERGISVGEGGDIAGAGERAKTFHAGPASTEKFALMQEIDRRYFETVGDKTKSKIKKGEEGKAALWRMIRDEVLFQHEYIAKLPPQVKELIKFSTRGKDLTPADYDKLFAIAKKIEKMPVEQVSDYASKVTGATTDLAVFEASLDKYIAEMAERGQQSKEREKIQTKLIGLEEVYKEYKLYKSLLTSSSMGAIAGRYSGGGIGTGIGTALVAEKVRKEIEIQLQAHGFAGLSEFEAFIKKFEQGFEHEAANIANDLLEKYAGKLYRESERYKNPSEVTALHQKLGGVRSQYRKFETNAKIWNDYAKARETAREQSRIPGQGHLQTRDFTSITSSEAEAARKQAEAAKGAAQSQVAGMSSEHPIFQEEGLPLDKRIDKAALARASESELGGLLQEHIQNRMKDIDEARAEIEGKPELIYKMDKLMPQFYAQQGIRPGSIHDMIIRDKIKSDAILKIVKGIALAIVAIALAVVSFGTATPAIVAAGAAIAGAGLGGYMALDEYQEYTQQKNLADVGLSDNPSMVWVILAVVGAGLDMAAAVKAVKALAPAAKTFNAGGDLAEFTRAVRALEQANEIEAKVARAAENAAAARKGLAEASDELTAALKGKLYAIGPLADPDVYKAIVKMARQAIKTKLYDAQKFIDELKLARVKAKLGDLTPEELAKAKQAWEEAKILEAADKARYEKLLTQIPDATKLDVLIAKAGDVEKLERLLKTFPVAELETVFARLTDSRHLITMLDHVGADTGASIIRQWMAKGQFAKMNQFMERLVGGVSKELAEVTALGGKSVIIDSNTAIALMKDAKPALRGTMHAGEKARVAYIKSLPAGTELRAGNVVIGEVGSGVINVKGLPLEVARDSAAYKKVLGELEKLKLGGGTGAADRALVADAFFAKSELGVIPRFITGDRNVVKKLAGMATPKIDVNAIGGYPELLRTYGTSGFNVTIEGRTLTVIPVP